jgi:tRNA-binding EMAP/Myf-like protein
VVGCIQVKDKHPNADKLSLCQVEIAPGKIEQIVCGAQNHKIGDKVIVALPGAFYLVILQLKNLKFVMLNQTVCCVR